MALVPAICTQCGAQIEVDNTHEAGICRQCGTAFITEKVILKFQGNVNVSGSTIRVDSSNEINNILQLARRAKDTSNFENAARYYEMVALRAPNNWEAYYNSISCKARTCIVKDIHANIIALTNCLRPTFSLINEMENTTEDKSNAIVRVARDAFCVAKLLVNGYNNHFASIDCTIRNQYANERAMINNAGILAQKNVINCITITFGNDTAVMMSLLPFFKKVVETETDKELRIGCVNIIKRYDRNYVAPKIKKKSKATKKSGGCYIATCVYGSYDCPEVWTLRRFRDFTLDETWYGRLFIRCYYAISPAIVNWFGETKWFRTFWKTTLDKMVRRLNEKGVENTKYSDKY